MVETNDISGEDRPRQESARRERAQPEGGEPEMVSEATTGPDRHFQDAQRLVGQVMDRAYHKRDVREFKIDTSGIEDDIVFSDLENDATEFSRDLEILRQHKFGAPAMRLYQEDFIPMSLETFIGWSMPGQAMESVRKDGDQSPFRDNFRYAFSRELNNRVQQGVVLLDHDEARNKFTKRAVDFLATRIRFLRKFHESVTKDWVGPYSFLTLPQSAGKQPVDTLGCLFTVSTNTSNLAVDVSATYSLSFRSFSGQLTSPVSEYLQSGSYIFGVIGGPYQSRMYDASRTVVLPGPPSVHLHY